MANLTKTNWPGGWNPSADAVNGDPNVLLRMDNLTLDKNGAITLIEGIQVGSAFSDYVSDIFSKIINGTEYFWIGLNPAAPFVFRIVNILNPSGTTLMSVSGAGNPTSRACFGDCLGQIIAIAGMMRTKDPVLSAPVPLGLLTPWQNGTSPTGSNVIGPTVASYSQPSYTLPDVYGLSVFLEYDTLQTFGGPDPATFFVDPQSLEGVVVTPGGLTPIDTIGLLNAGVATPSTNIYDPGTDIIQITVNVINQPTSTINTIELDFILSTYAASQSGEGLPQNDITYSDMYAYIFQQSDIPGGGNSTFTLSTTRNQFFRYGSNTNLNWTTVTGARVVVNASAQVEIAISQPKFLGGQQGQLNGVYNYIQISVANNGKYLAKSPVSPYAVIGSSTGTTNDISVINGAVQISPIKNDPNANEYWFFRQSATDTGVDPNTGLPLNQSSLDQFYFVGKSTGGIFTDTLSDTSVLELNADGSLLPNQFLWTMRSSDNFVPVGATLPNGLQDNIYSIEGLYNERMLYMGATNIYLSDRLNPDAIDTRFILKPSGDATEKNLWIKKLTNNVLILATTKTLYEISGTLLDQPDGSIDVNIINLGESYPPLSSDCWNVNGGIFYVAADGLRVTTGSNTTNLSSQLRLLFQQGESRHGVPNVAIIPNNQSRYSITVGHGRIYFICPMSDGTRRLFTYDLSTQTFSLRYTDPVIVYTTQQDEVVAGYGTETLPNAVTVFGLICILDSNNSNGIVGNGITQGFNINFRTVFDSNNQPRNRKDTFTLKLIMDTGGQQVNVGLQRDGIGITPGDETSYISLGNFSTSGLQPIYIPLNNPLLTLGFRYSLNITDVSGLFKFLLYEYTIEYEARPEQLDYLRLLPSNLGTVSRKRITGFAIIIDTLGNSISFTPYLDNIAWSSTGIINNGTKLTYIFFFTSEAIATDIGGTLSGGVFEFYGVSIEESVSEKLPTPCEFLVIPANNYGTPNRKRHTSYKFQILTRNQPVQFTPILDGVAHAPTTYTTPTKQTVEYFFPQTDGDVIGKDIGGTLASLTSTPFEFYGVIIPQTVEQLPDRLEYFRIPNTNLGTDARKRFIAYAFVIDTGGQNVILNIIIDGNSSYPTAIVNTTGKTTFVYYFKTETLGTDIGGWLSGGPIFEFYGLNLEECVSEKLPAPTEFLVIPANNYGTPNRKRHTSYKFQINTRGQPVSLVPIVDGISYESFTFSTPTKQLMEYYFSQADGDIIGRDIGGTLSSVIGVPFEFYGVVTPQRIEQLPDRLEYFRIPNNSFGVAARKRVRTIPIVIDTYGQPVTFTPIVDGVLQTNTTTFNTLGKTTVFHYFSTDTFGIDYGGILQSTTSTPFEFYELMQPEDVETLPVAKRYDQLGPLRFDRIGKIFMLRIRLIQTGGTNSIPFTILGDGNFSDPSYDTSPQYAGSFSVVPGIDTVYEIPLPKSVNTGICRVVLGPVGDPFHRFDMKVKVSLSGEETDSQWIPIR